MVGVRKTSTHEETARVALQPPATALTNLGRASRKQWANLLCDQGHDTCAKEDNMQLVLADGTAFRGDSFGAARDVRGEVVFNTAMTGYVEALTDPSYRGQILVLTYPLQGNYGVPAGPFESPQVQVQGVVVSHVSTEPNHHTSLRTLGQWLQAADVPAMCGVDTRAITRHLREYGTIEGALLGEHAAHRLTSGAQPPSLVGDAVDMRRIMHLVAPREVTHYPGGRVQILVIDTGAKETIIRSLLKRGTRVIRAPWMMQWEEYLPVVDGIVLTNGPGDPADMGPLVERIRRLLDSGLPMFGICLGHQLLGLAAGAQTYKLKYGHRSVNQPVMDLMTRRTFITSQNHGYAVCSESLPEEWDAWFINLNDGTNEGIRHRSRPLCSVQFHPEASPGPQDTAFLFDQFLHTARQFHQVNSGNAAVSVA